MRAHSESERSVWYIFLMHGRVPNCHYPTPTFRTVSQKLSEKGSERGFDRRFGQYTNAKTARKVSFRCPVRLRCRGVRYFSDSFTKRILGNWASGVWNSRKLRRYKKRVRA